MPPPADRPGGPLQRLGAVLRRRLRPDRGDPPAMVPGLGSGEETAIAATVRAEPAEGAVEPDEPEEATEAGPEVMAVAPPPGPEGATTDPEREVAPDGDARIDAARARLRARIEPPDPDADRA